jgi:hypothetical protein
MFDKGSIESYWLLAVGFWLFRSYAVGFRPFSNLLKGQKADSQ